MEPWLNKASTKFILFMRKERAVYLLMTFIISVGIHTKLD